MLYFKKVDNKILIINCDGKLISNPLANKEEILAALIFIVCYKNNPVHIYFFSKVLIKLLDLDLPGHNNDDVHEEILDIIFELESKKNQTKELINSIEYCYDNFEEYGYVPTMSITISEIVV